MKSSRVASGLLIAFGFLISLGGIVGLIWMQVDLPFQNVPHEASLRWQAAMGSLTVLALGVLVSVGGLIVGELQTRNARQPISN